MLICSCSASSEYRRNNPYCNYCTDDNPITDCRYCEFDEFDDEFDD